MYQVSLMQLTWWSWCSSDSKVIRLVRTQTTMITHNIVFVNADILQYRGRCEKGAEAVSEGGWATRGRHECGNNLDWSRCGVEERGQRGTANPLGAAHPLGAAYPLGGSG